MQPTGEDRTVVGRDDGVGSKRMSNGDAILYFSSPV